MKALRTVLGKSSYGLGRNQDGLQPVADVDKSAAELDSPVRPVVAVARRKTFR
jgi:hypothetical protein